MKTKTKLEFYSQEAKDHGRMAQYWAIGYRARKGIESEEFVIAQVNKLARVAAHFGLLVLSLKEVAQSNG